MQAQGPTVVDLFAGVGGLSLGFEMAGANVIAAVESNPHHVEAYKNGHISDCVTILGRVEHISAYDITSRTNVERGGVDFVVGGPPCQPFSLAGKRHGTADERGNLVSHFVRLVSELRPRAFVMENVVGLRSIHGGSLFDQLMFDLEANGYRCLSYTLDAAQYGVPQRRNRLFIVGTRIDATLLRAPSPTHRINDDLSLLVPSLPRARTVRDAIWDLRGSRFHKMTGTIDDSVRLAYYTDAPNEYQRLMRGREVAVSGNGVTRHVPHILANIHVLALPQGSVEPSTRYRRLYWNRPSYTLRAGSGSFTALRPIHPSQSRVITVREAARLQSFPDRVQFSPIKKWSYQQIGNSVPPLLGSAIAATLIETLFAARTRAFR